MFTYSSINKWNKCFCSWISPHWCGTRAFCKPIRAWLSCLVPTTRGPTSRWQKEKLPLKKIRDWRSLQNLVSSICQKRAPPQHQVKTMICTNCAVSFKKSSTHLSDGVWRATVHEPGTSDPLMEFSNTGRQWLVTSWRRWGHQGCTGHKHKAHTHSPCEQKGNGNCLCGCVICRTRGKINYLNVLSLTWKEQI